MNNSLSPPTNWSFSRGYWAGLLWANTNPAPGVYDFSELDAILSAAILADQYVEVNALVGQCSPSWIYSSAGGVTPVKVNWKPPPQCVPPECVPAGTWECSRNGGQGCGCDGAGWPPLTKCTPGAGCGCNQTFPDYLGDPYRAHQKDWIVATHKHIMGLSPELKKRVLSVQGNAGSTGDGCAYHGRIYPEQRLAGLDKIQNKSVFDAYQLEVLDFFVETYSKPGSPMLLLNALFSQPNLWASINASSLAKTGYMIKAGSVSHSYSCSGEQDKADTVGVLMKAELVPGSGIFVRSRGETTLSALPDWQLQPHWTSWALATWNLAFGMDTWQNNSLIEEQPRMRPALSFFSHYAGARKPSESPGAWAVLRDGLDTADIERFPEEQFGNASNGKNLERCYAVIASVNSTTEFPPRLDAPTSDGCGSGRQRAGLNDAGWRVHRGNYAMFLEQVDPDETSVGAWRAGPGDEIFGRYGRTAKRNTGSLHFNLQPGIITGGQAFARVVFLDAAKGASFKLTMAAAGGASECGATAVVTGKGSGHWVEARLPLTALAATQDACDQGQGLVLTQLSGKERIVFNLLEVSKAEFKFALSPWASAAAPA